MIGARILPLLRPLAGTGLALAIPACNALTGADDFTTAPDVPLEPQEITPDDASAAPDVSSSSSSSGGPSIDGGDGSAGPRPDGGDAGDAEASAPLGFCASLSPAPELCTDFDDGVFPGPWTVVTSGLGAAVSSKAVSRSAPRAVTLSSAGGAGGMAYLTETFASPATTEVAFGFSIRADQVRPVETELAVVFLGSSGGNRYELQLELLDGGILSLEEESPQANGTITETDRSLGRTLPLGEWKNVSMTIALGATSSTLTFALEGTAAVSLPLSAHLYKAAPRVELGHNSTTSAAFAVHYDDVYVRVK